MQVYRARAFTHNTNFNGKSVLGNPASVVFCNQMMPSKEEMSRIAVTEKAPMTAFLSQKLDNHFDIEFYTPAGERFCLCGHATLVAAYFVYQQYGYDNVFFHKLIRVNDNISEVIESNKVEDIFTIDMPAYKPNAAKNLKTDWFATIMGIENYKSVYFCHQLKDIIIMLHDTKALRKAKPLYHELAVILAADNIRGIFLTAKSTEVNIDYEVRIFAPHLGINEDISCGSANCSLLPLWHKYLGATNGDYFSILCPYDKASDFLGGVETGSYNETKKRIYIGGRISE
ncbi:MAG: PhzF family phenazine biosynthesis protein [Pedobacter sp.]|nr:PhzF family phenazine biosynthesis protein [Chitinophagaceae bacterium]